MRYIIEAYPKQSYTETRYSEACFYPNCHEGSVSQQEAVIQAKLEGARNFHKVTIASTVLGSPQKKPPSVA